MNGMYDPFPEQHNYDWEAGRARIDAAQRRKTDRVHNSKSLNRRRNKQARKQRRHNGK